MYSRAPAVRGLLLALLAMLAVAPSAMAQSANGMAMFVDYNAPPNWDLRASAVSCAVLDGDMPFKWRQHYWWAAFCGPAGPSGDAACGLCVQVTNAGSGATMTVRIVDDCGKLNDGAVLGIEKDGLTEIDTDHRGWHAGQLEVNYQFVDCQDV